MRMRLSVVFELLLVFLFLAFAAARVIDPAKGTKNVAVVNKKTTTALRQGPPNRYCACTSRMCNCCRDFSLPVVPIKGPGCASIMYVQRDTMMVTMSFGDRVLSNTTISGKTPKPICMPLPGGISQFCGRVYGISRKGEQFRACLGLELRALDDIEAALRVSCFKFGPKGVKLESAPPVPTSSSGGKDPEEDEDDDYDLDDDEDDEIIGFGVDDDDDATSSEDNEVDSDSVDYTGFSVLGEDILGSFFSDDSESSGSKKKKPNKKTAKPQVVVPKISTTTRRPILGIKRRSTVKPLSSVTSRPVLNIITRRPTVSTIRPLLVQRPSVPVIIPTQGSAKPSFNPDQSVIVTKHGADKNVVTKSTTTTTEAPVTTRIITTMQSQESEKVHMTEEVSQETTVVTEEPITFTIPTERVEVVKNDIKLPQTDLAKLEAVAAIAQQDVTSGVISSSSLTTEEVEKPMEMVTVKYEKITPSYAPQTTPSYYPENTQKISSVKFVPTTVVTSRPSAEVVGDSSEGAAVGEIFTKPQLVGIKNKVSFHQQTKTQNNAANYQGPIAQGIKIDKNPLTKRGNYTVNLKKRPVKRPEKEEDEKEQEEEEEEEEEQDEEAEEEDILEGVLEDEEETDDEEEASQTTNKDEASDEEEEDEEIEEDTLGETIHTTQKVKPSKVSVKKKPPSADSENEEEEEEEEEDILEVLGDDEEEEESDDDEEEEEEEEAEPVKIKKKRRPTTQATTIKTKRPTTQHIIQTKKPLPTTEATTKPDEKVTESFTEKVIIYKEPVEKITEKVIIYQEPAVHKIPNKIFIYKDPENKISQQTTQKIIFYKEPVQQSVTEKFVIYKEPQIKVTEKPIIMEDNKSDEDVKDNSDEDRIEHDEDSSEEEFEEDDSGGKHTLVASIVRPGFSNKYAEEHDLTENDDLDIEDSDDEGNDFEEDRKMKAKKQVQKSPPSKKPEVQVSSSKPKVLSLSDLIGQRKKHYEDKPISTSRTHRRMNLDRLLELQGTSSVGSAKSR